MESRRGAPRNDVYYSQETSRRRSSNKKPPRGSWQPTVPAWEKTFCKEVGSIDWETFVDKKKFAHIYDNVLKWDDSAGEEAFNNAKERFLAKRHGYPCDMSLPDPDLFIDKVDWDSTVDLELLLDLEHRYSVNDTTENKEPVVIFGDSLLHNQGFSSTGWGDCEEDLKIATDSSNNQKNPWEQNLCQSKGIGTENGWGDFGNNVYGGSNGAAGWQGSWENSWSWNHPENQKKSKNRRGIDNFCAWGTWDVKNAKKNQAGRLMSRYRTSRLNGNERPDTYAWKDERPGTYAWRDGIGQTRAACF